MARTIPTITPTNEIVPSDQRHPVTQAEVCSVDREAPLSGSGKRFLEELRRRKVINSAGLYLGVAFIVMQVVEVVFPYARFPDAAGSIVLALLVVGFPIATDRYSKRDVAATSQVGWGWLRESRRGRACE